MQEADALRELAMMLLKDIRMMTLFVLLLIAAAIDLRTYRIPNWLTGLGAAAALAFSVGVPPSAPHGIWWALQGCGLALLIMLPLYALRAMGAGDAKLMAVAGLYLGPFATLVAILACMIVGGLLALAYSVLRGSFNRLMQNLRNAAWQGAASIMTRQSLRLAPDASSSIGRLPFAVSIALGTTGTVLVRHFGFY